ncbi:MAG: Gmad2 immunoglobulin-like domain-containing protein [Nocardioides sp.]|uniref:Gmad2 immunoglobulin-like domain-containing protein n=1 Tax=Nocardioides sp. TaxID=35761 RepID=UPI002602C1AD|nr:Gmad2 immunoglobulin-like domain-containing protein [Nocardioides sp.]
MDDARLAALLEDAVSDVEPAHRIGEIRERVQPSRQRWWYAGGGLVAAAATVAAVGLVVGGPPERGVDPVGTPTPSATPDEDVRAELPTLYWIGTTPQGPRLFGEQTFVNAGYGESQLHAVLRSLVVGTPEDPDYRSPWTAARLLSARETDDGIVVTIDLGLDGSAPYLGIEQVVYTVWDLLDERAPVTVDVRTEGPRRPVTVTSRDDLSVLSLVQVDSPAEGQEVSGSFTVNGMASSYEATVPWRLEDASGRVVRDGFATAEGWMGALYPWETEVDVSGLAPGTYTFVASTSDPSGGTEGPGPTTDTRTVVVR